jgi:hypothetical protein
MFSDSFRKSSVPHEDRNGRVPHWRAGKEWAIGLEHDSDRIAGMGCLALNQFEIIGINKQIGVSDPQRMCGSRISVRVPHR